MSGPTRADLNIDTSKRYSEISDLSPQTSQDYAKAQEAFDPGLISGAVTISHQTQVEVTQPIPSLEKEEIFFPKKEHLPQALFSAPKGYFEQKRRLFTHQLIPSMGSDDKRESQTQKITNKLNSYIEEHKALRPHTEIDKKSQYEQTRKLEEKEREKTILISLFTTINDYDKLIDTVNSGRIRYQKG